MPKTGPQLQRPIEAAPPEAESPRQRSRPAPEERQESILKAALEVFSENGFAAARLEDVALRAGVAKGTLYLYFPDKETLFEHMLKSVTEPAMTRLASLASQSEISLEDALAHILDFIQTEILDSPREKVMRLIISEGPRFPRLARFYYDEVVAKGIAAVRAIASRNKGPDMAHAEALARFPQLIFAPVLASVVWRSLFSEFEPLDVQALIEAHKEILLASHREGQP